MRYSSIIFSVIFINAPSTFKHFDDNRARCRDYKRKCICFMSVPDLCTRKSRTRKRGFPTFDFAKVQLPTAITRPTVRLRNIIANSGFRGKLIAYPHRRDRPCYITPPANQVRSSIRAAFIAHGVHGRGLRCRCSRIINWRGLSGPDNR